MVFNATPGRFYYGVPIGVLKFEDALGAAVPGAVCNATTFDFPIILSPVKGASFERIYSKDMSILPAAIEAAKWLETQGVRAITTSCGFWAYFQREIAEAVDTPVFLSSLLQVPFMCQGLSKTDKIGVLTATAKYLDSDFLQAVGVDESRIVVRGLEDKPYFRSHVLDEEPEINTDEICKEVVDAAEELVRQNPSIKMMLLECSELPPYAAEVQKKINMPVFDFYTMIDYLYTGTVRKPFDGYM